MSDLVKAELQVIDKNDKVTEKIPVQFNPTSMNLTMSNSTDGGSSRGRQAEQYNGSASTQLSLDLQFDTAEEGTAGSPVDVRTKTDKIRQFVLPGGTGSKQAPPRVRFEWGPFGLTGVMNSLTEELSLFSRDGVPLRSKMSIQIKEQDARFAALKSGPGANADTKPAAAGAGSAGAGPGSSGSGIVDRAVAALAGESPADFLARNGLDPEAWRGLGDALSALGDGLELSAGVSVGFDTTLSLGGGLEARGGVHVGLDAPASASLGLEASAGARVSAESARAQGFALSSAGGVTSAAEQAKTVDASGAQDTARTAFGGAPAGGAASVPPPGGDRMPLAASGTVRRVASGSAPPPARADRRATTYGYGIPLRDRVEVPGAESDGYVVIGSRNPIATSGSRHPGAPWGSLRSSRARSASDAQRRRTGCGCDGDPWSDLGAGCHGEGGGAGCRCTSGK